jgi:hypothetical protein
MKGNGISYRALICITTCQRFAYVRRYLPQFGRFCEADPRFALVVALDGTEPEYLGFCEKWKIPLIYSEDREGVGLSKNRVLEWFPDFDYYFFLDDDVELVDGLVFPAHVELARNSGIHHFSLFERGGVRNQTSESFVAGRRIVHGMFGGGQFNFFSREGLKQVGGWHPFFARYRRWGHTEHSYRFFRAGLAPAPFNVAEDLSESCIWHYPVSVTRVDSVETDENQITVSERELIDAELIHVPLQTLSPHHFNGQPFHRLGQLAATLAGGERYPLVGPAERGPCWSDYHLWRYALAQSIGKRLGSLASAARAWPGNPNLRHVLWRTLQGKKP